VVIIETLSSLYFLDSGDGALQVSLPANGDKPGIGHVPPKRFAIIHPLVGMKILDRRIEAVQKVPPSLLRGPQVQPLAESAGRGVPGSAIPLPFLQILPDEAMQIGYHQAEKAPGLENPKAFPKESAGFLEIEVFQKMGSVDNG